MPTLYLTEEYSLVRRDSEDMLLVQIPERQGKDGGKPAPARKERIPLVKVDELLWSIQRPPFTPIFQERGLAYGSVPRPSGYGETL